MRIDVKGVIVPNDDAWIYEWFNVDHTSPAMVNNAIAEAKGEKLEVYINSCGGDVFSGSEIYSALREYSGDVEIKITGLAASAASVIAMARTCRMAPTAQLMVHNVSMRAGGDYHDMDKASEILKKANEALANAYTQKSGMDKEDVLALMDVETWLTADDAVEFGLVDGIIEEFNSAQLVATYGEGFLPARLVSDFKRRRAAVKEKILNLKTEDV